MAKRLGKRTVSENTTSLDGVLFELVVIRDEDGTYVVLEAKDRKPGFEGGVIRLQGSLGPPKA